MIMRSLSTITLIALGLSVSSCGGTKNRGLESVHQPVVSRTNYVFDAQTGSEGLAPGEASRVQGWFESLQVGYGDHVAVDTSEGYGANDARTAVAAIAARYGLLVDDVSPVTAGDVAPGSVRVVVSRMSAAVPGCPDWSRKSQPEFNSNGMSNYGCATNSNIAAMVANPEDLIRGRDSAKSVDAATSGKAIKTYREAKPTGATGLKSESTKGAN
jgi:pilus assembly protein CpaD